jgi:hypothetical protein
MSTIVVDLDGTLFNHDHRIDWAKSGMWDEYHRRLVHDELNEDVAWLLQVLPSSVEVIFCTGRNERWRQLTLDHCCFCGLGLAFPDALLMRPDDNYLPDHELKPKMLEEHFGSRDLVLDNVKFVLDDREKVVEAWRNYGLPCWQVRLGSF